MMPIPGLNILSMATRLIATPTISYYVFVSRQVQANGLLVPTYTAPVNIQASVQAVPRRLFEQNGLDMQREYYTVFIPQNTIDVGRDVSGDQIHWNGLILQCESVTRWFGMDGWDEILTVKVP